MALTKVTGDFIKDGVLTQAHLHTSHGITTAHIGEGSNLYFTNARVDSRIGDLSTSNLSEGSNLYYTDARARAAISVSGNALSYNSSTGVITSNFEESPTFTGAVVGASFSAAGGFLNGSNGGIRIHSSGTKFFNITAANAARDGVMDIGASDARFKDLYLSGNITASGYNNSNWDTAYGWGDHSAAGYLASSSYTAADVLSKILTVDGPGSGLDADLLDGSHASSFWTKSGSWYGDLGSHSYTREIGLTMTGGSEFVVLSKSGQGSVLVDGHYMAYESANGFFGSYNSTYGNLTGIRASAANTLKVMQLDGGNAILEVTQDARAPIFYDSNDTGYYVDPASTSNLNTLSTDTNARIFNNQNRNHSTYTNFNDTGLRAGINYLQQGTNGPTGTASHQWYGFRLGLGGDYGTQTGSSGHYAQEWYIARKGEGGNSTGGNFLWTRDMEGGSWGSWSKIDTDRLQLASGYAVAQGDWGARNTTPYGWIQFGPANTSHAHIYTDRSNFYFNAQIQLLGGSLINQNDIRAQVFYDVNSTTYYLNPAATGAIDAIKTAGGAQIGTTTAHKLVVAGNGNYMNINYDQIWNAGGNLHLQYSSSGNIDMNQGGGYAFSRTSLRAPIFYDYNDTAYYVNPNTTSNLNTLQVADAIRTDRYEDISGNFMMRKGTNSGTTRHFNLADATSDPSDIASSHTPIGITWGQRGDNNPYYIIRCRPSYSNGYSTHSRLDLSWHTGVEIGAHPNYGGTRFFNNSSFTGSEIMRVGSGNSDVYINNIGTAGSSLRAPIFYDSDNTGYYIDPASTTVLNGLNTNSGDITATHFGIANTSNGSRDGIALYGSATGGEPTYGLLFTGTSLGTHGGVTGDWATYFTMNNDTNRGWIFRRVGTGNSASISAGGLATFDNSVRSPIFYDSNNTNYYTNPASSSRMQNIDITSAGASGLLITHSDIRSSATSNWTGNPGGAGKIQYHSNRWYIVSDSSSNRIVQFRRDGSDKCYIDNDGRLMDVHDVRAYTYYDRNDTNYYTNPAAESIIDRLGRREHHRGHFEGSYNNVGGNSTYTNPIYTIGSSYNPNSTTLGNMYGIGFAHPNLWGGGKTSDWGLYVAAGGNFEATIGQGTTTIWASNNIVADGGVYGVAFYDQNNTGYYVDANSLSTMHSIKLIEHVNNTPRWDFSAYVVEAQHWYGNSGSQTMYLGESNHINIRNTADIHGDARSPIYYDRANTGYYTRPATSSNMYSIYTASFVQVGASGSSNLWLGGQSGNYFRFHTNNSHTYFDANVGDIHWRQGSSTRFYFYMTTANMTINGTLTQYSDERLKQNVVTIDNALNKVNQLRGVYYNRTDINTEANQIGLIAQETESVVPEVVHTANDELGTKSISYGQLNALLVEAIKELKADNDSLRARIETLENQ